MFTDPQKHDANPAHDIGHTQRDVPENQDYCESTVKQVHAPKYVANNIIYDCEMTRDFDRSDWLELAELAIDQALEHRGDHALRRLYGALHSFNER